MQMILFDQKHLPAPRTYFRPSNTSVSAATRERDSFRVLAVIYRLSSICVMPDDYDSSHHD